MALCGVLVQAHQTTQVQSLQLEVGWYIHQQFHHQNWRETWNYVATTKHYVVAKYSDNWKIKIRGP